VFSLQGLETRSAFEIRAGDLNIAIRGRITEDRLQASNLTEEILIRKHSGIRKTFMAFLTVLSAMGIGVVLMAMAKPPQTPGAVTDVDPHKAFGSKNAPFTMEVFSDFQCPACKSLYTSTNRELMDNYVSAGKVYLIHRDFPLPMHAHSKVAAEYARAAAHLGKAEQVEQALFQNQEKWENTGDVDGTVAAVLSPAEMTKVRALVKGGTLDPLIEKDMALGRMYNVNQTPTTIIHANGQTYPVVGIQSYAVLHQFLDQLLSQK
jgi:protein-disulfide isomerase